MKWLLAERAVVPEIHMNGNQGFTLWFRSTISRQSRNYQEKKSANGTSYTHTRTRTHGKIKRRKKSEDYIRYPG